MGNAVKSSLKPGLGESEIESRRLQEQLKQVKEKLRKANKGTSKKGENELQDLAEKLLDKEKTKQEFFGHLLEYTEEARRVVSGEQKTFPRGFPNYGTRNDSEQRMAEPPLLPDLHLRAAAGRQVPTLQHSAGRLHHQTLFCCAGVQVPGVLL